MIATEQELGKHCLNIKSHRIKKRSNLGKSPNLPDPPALPANLGTLNLMVFNGTLVIRAAVAALKSHQNKLIKAEHWPNVS